MDLIFEEEKKVHLPMKDFYISSVLTHDKLDDFLNEVYAHIYSFN